MITEEQAMRLFDEANPIPDIESLDLHPVGGPHHLENLDLRSRDMTDTDTKHNEQTARKPTTGRWLAAAAVIVLVAGLAFILMNRAQNETAETPPATVAEVTPTTAAPPTTEPATPTTVDSAEAAWQELPVLIGPNPLPRTYRTSTFEPSFSVEIRAGWRSAPPETADEITLTTSTEFDRLNNEEPATGIYFRDFGFGGVEDTIQGFNSGFAAINLTVTPLGSTSIGGAEGQLLEISPRSQTIQCCDGGGATMLFHQEKRYLAHVVDVTGTGVAVIVQAPADDFDSFQERAQRILDTIVWRDLG